MFSAERWHLVKPPTICLRVSIQIVQRVLVSCLKSFS